MNAIYMRLEMDRLNDRVKSPRYQDDSYYSAINQAISLTCNDRIDNIKQRKPYSLQSIQRVRDELYTLIAPTVTLIPVADVITFPADYYYHLYVECTIDGKVNYAIPTDYNKIGPIKQSSLRKPSDDKPYFNEVGTGLKISHGSGTFTSATFDYLKKPARVSIGNEGNKISAGASVLTPGSTYYVYDIAVHAGVTYYEGETFVATLITLTSGTVIASVNVTNCDLPDLLQDEVIRLATAILTGTTENFAKKQALQKDNEIS